MTDSCWTGAEREIVLAEIADGLWRYVAARAGSVSLAAEMLADLTVLSAEAIATLRHVHAVLSPEVREFVLEALPALLRRLGPRTQLETRAARHAVRGRIDWGATSAARARAGGDDRALFVTAAPRTVADTAEARLLLWLLRALAASCAHICTEVRAEGADGVGPGAEGWLAWAGQVAAAVDGALLQRHLSGLSSVSTAPAALLTADLAACRRSSHHEVRVLARAARRYHDMVVHPDVATLVESCRERALAPLDDDVLYEVWALLGAARVCDERGWTLTAAGLSGRAPAPFTYRSPDGRATARLWFGHTPAAWRRASRYRGVFAAWGLAGAVRRPDLIVQVTSRGRSRYALVEVKRTRDRQYIADSIYKVLGYMADFAPVFAGQAGAHALLLVWDGLAAPRVPVPDGLLLATHSDYRRLFAVILDGLRRE